MLKMANLIDLDPHDVAGLEPFRRLHRARDAAWRAGRNQCPGFQRKDRRKHLDQLETIEDQIARVRMLAQLAVDEGLEFERMRVAQLVGGDDPRSDRPVGIERLAERHGRRTPLPITHADIVDDEIPRDHLARAVAWHMTASAADNESQLALVVERFGGARQMNRIIRRVDATRLFVKKEREGRLLHPSLGDMVGVIEPHREKLGRAAHRRFELHLRQWDLRGALGGAPRLLEHLLAAVEEIDHVARNQRRGRADVGDRIALDDPNPRLPLMSESYEFHLRPPAIQDLASNSSPFLPQSADRWARPPRGRLLLKPDPEAKLS